MAGSILSLWASLVLKLSVESHIHDGSEKVVCCQWGIGQIAGHMWQLLGCSQLFDLKLEVAQGHVKHPQDSRQGTALLTATY